MGTIILALPLLMVLASSALLNQALAKSLVPLENNEHWLSDPVLIGGSESAFEPQMNVWGDNLYFVWSSNGVMFSRSIDGGQTFSDPIMLAKYPIDSPVTPAPRIAAYNENIYVIYSTGKDIFLLRSNDNGKSFSEPINVSKMDAEDSPAAVITGHVISVAEDRVYVAWSFSSYSWSDIFFAQSDDRGASFGEHVNVSNNPESSTQPEIASSGSDVYLVWIDAGDNRPDSISFARSNDAGQSFQSIANISDNDPWGSYEPEVAADGNAAYLVWRDEVPISNETGNIYSKIAFARSTDLGKTFNINRYVADGAWPSMAISGNNIYIAFGVQEFGIENIGFVKSADHGSTFSTQMMLSNQTWAQNPYDLVPLPQIAADEANVFVVWRYTTGSDKDAANNHETFLATSYDNGKSFTKQLNISESQDRETSEDPSIVGTLDKVYVLWLDSVPDGSTMMLVRGQIPEEYTAPFREVGLMTPVEPYSPWPIAIVAILVATAAGATAYYLKKRTAKGSKESST